ncbi:methyltransferase domain-containing protein [Catenulispora sp. NF23]|uniref:Methyltransferase domain-containing protein n=1 Tax=Catenulispora pinistramenti TaxID=2705254 RepID=A0ABS5KTF2_9ACTN|nr:methyltransferase domain-containing protein [Catenulispora pinistramenti]MBS2534601.1 methyltransferase domain-containing protein [Catenulispora pinistramenti]MBS2549332.1 methyltransferase domain-containing protein [Catenulispora pinistramenti]
MISDVVDWLSCPHCATALIVEAGAGSRLVCEEGHAFDVARPGYVSLLAGAGAGGTADTAAMVADRAAFLGAGHYAGIADLVAGLASEVGAGDDSEGTCVLDLGAGTGYYLARVLDAVDRPGIALDISKHAARLAAKAHPRIGAVVADAWAGLPVRGRSASVVLNVFAPRNPREMRRVLHPRGRAIVVVPEPDHLRELIAEYALMAVDDRKPERLREQFADRFRIESEHPHSARPTLSAEQVSQVVGMGPNAWHERAEEVRSGGAVTVAVRAYVLSPT